MVYALDGSLTPVVIDDSACVQLRQMGFVKGGIDISVFGSGDLFGRFSAFPGCVMQGQFVDRNTAVLLLEILKHVSTTRILKNVDYFIA